MPGFKSCFHFWTQWLPVTADSWRLQLQSQLLEYLTCLWKTQTDFRGPSCRLVQQAFWEWTSRWKKTFWINLKLGFIYWNTFTIGLLTTPFQISWIKIKITGKQAALSIKLHLTYDYKVLLNSSLMYHFKLSIYSSRQFLQGIP